MQTNWYELKRIPKEIGSPKVTFLPQEGRDK